MSQPSPLLVAGLVALAFAGTAAGCGEDDTLSAQEYRTQATKICTDSEKETDAIKEPAAEKDVEPFLTKGIEVTNGYVESFKELAPPEDLQDKHDAAANAISAQVDRLEALRDEIKGGTDAEKAFSSASTALDTGEKDTDAKFRALGLAKCADN